MQVAVRGDYNETSSIHTLPFIHANLSDTSTLYTTLLFAEEQCGKITVQFGPITFDCPLYFKSAEIIAASGSEFQHICTRLGGFHWLMSAKGAIGYIMGGSGLEELFSLQPKMASGVKPLDEFNWGETYRRFGMNGSRNSNFISVL